MPSCPLAHETVYRGRQRTANDSTGLDGDDSPVALVRNVEMRRRMVGEEHPDRDTEKAEMVGIGARRKRAGLENGAEVAQDQFGNNLSLACAEPPLI